MRQVSSLKAYLVATLVLPVILCYPAMTYLDLAGMGGYDGFASPAMMLEYGAWRLDADGIHPVYAILNGVYLLWWLALLNLPVAALVVIGRWARRKRPTA